MGAPVSWLANANANLANANLGRVATRLSSGEQSRLRDALVAVCRQVGLDPTGAELIKYTMNAVFRLDKAGVIVRLAAGPQGAARVDRVVQVAARFADLGLPTVRLATGFDHAVHIEGWSASIWALMAQPLDQVWTPIDLAAPLRAIHAIDDPVIPLPDWDPVAKSRDRLAAIAGLDEDDRHYLRDWSAKVGTPLEEIVDRLYQWSDEVDEAVARLEWYLPQGVIHGDAHTGNLLVASDGRATLCDLDSVARGPREWDLTPAAHGPARFGRNPAEYAAFAKEYGYDVTTWPGWETLRQIRELQLVTSVIASLLGRPAVADELAHRMRSILASNRASTWHRYT
jgi:hypothetical protein